MPTLMEKLSLQSLELTLELVLSLWATLCEYLFAFSSIFLLQALSLNFELTLIFLFSTSSVSEMSTLSSTRTLQELVSPNAASPKTSLFFLGFPFVHITSLPFLHSSTYVITLISLLYSSINLLLSSPIHFSLLDTTACSKLLQFQFFNFPSFL